MIQYLSRDPAQYTPACGEPPGMETPNNIGVEEEQNPRSLLRSFDSCFESCFDSLFDICFDRSSAGSTDHSVRSTRRNLLYACCCCCRCRCS